MLTPAKADPQLNIQELVNFNGTTTKPSKSTRTSWVPLYPIMQDATGPWGPADNRSIHADLSRTQWWPKICLLPFWGIHLSRLKKQAGKRCKRLRRQNKTNSRADVDNRCCSVSNNLTLWNSSNNFNPISQMCRESNEEIFQAGNCKNHESYGAHPAVTATAVHHCLVTLVIRAAKQKAALASLMCSILISPSLHIQMAALLSDK